MKASRKSSQARSTRSPRVEQQLTGERELRGMLDTVLRLAKSIGVAETEVHVDETISALTRFANNAIHQNVAEHTLNVSVRTQVDRRTARATTNRIDEDSLRAAIEASLSLAHSQPKNPQLLPYRRFRDERTELADRQFAYPTAGHAGLRRPKQPPRKPAPGYGSEIPLNWFFLNDFTGIKVIFFLAESDSFEDGRLHRYGSVIRKLVDHNGIV